MTFVVSNRKVTVIQLEATVHSRHLDNRKGTYVFELCTSIKSTVSKLPIAKKCLKMDRSFPVQPQAFLSWDMPNSKS